jgi:hypothetical protein
LPHSPTDFVCWTKTNGVKEEEIIHLFLIFPTTISTCSTWKGPFLIWNEPLDFKVKPSTMLFVNPDEASSSSTFSHVLRSSLSAAHPFGEQPLPGNNHLLTSGYDSPTNAGTGRASASEAYDQVIFYVAPIALTITVCLCCIRLCLVYCMHLRSHRNGSSRSSSTRSTSREARNIRSRRDLLPYTIEPIYGAIFTQTPPPKYDEAMKAARRHQLTRQLAEDNHSMDSSVLPVPDERQAPPPYAEESARSASVTPNTSRRQDVILAPEQLNINPTITP